MKTQRELDIYKEEQRYRFATLKEAVLKEHLGDRYQMLEQKPGEVVPEDQSAASDTETEGGY